VHAKDIKCLLEWWEKHKSLFSIVAFLEHHIFGIVGFYLKTEKIFSLPRIFTNLKKCYL
jgi:hypothetical protein